VLLRGGCLPRASRWRVLVYCFSHSVTWPGRFFLFALGQVRTAAALHKSFAVFRAAPGDLKRNAELPGNCLGMAKCPSKAPRRILGAESERQRGRES
jgi:hypothetical protein